MSENEDEVFALLKEIANKWDAHRGNRRRPSTIWGNSTTARRRRGRLRAKAAKHRAAADLPPTIYFRRESACGPRATQRSSPRLIRLGRCSLALTMQNEHGENCGQKRVSYDQGDEDS